MRQWLFLVLTLTLPCGATLLTNFGYVSNGQVSPEGYVMPFMDVWQGRMHINGQGYFSSGGSPVTITGFYSQTDPYVMGVEPSAFPYIFQGGWAIPHAPLDFNFSAALDEVRENCLAHNHWWGHQDSLELTTLIRFDGPVYHAAQYAESQISGQDTTWHTPWVTMPLPWPPQPVAIVVEGVARVKGVVSGQVTLLAADSLFIMGDLITTDTVLSPCEGDPPSSDTLFGSTPPGSPHRIGLIGERDVIVAATLENGFANGMHSPGLTCGLPSDPVVSVCGQARRDVIITASILALGCSFQVEYWKTTAWGATPPPTGERFECPGDVNAHVQLWDETECPGAWADSDRRGTLWFCGSLAVGQPGFTIRNPIGPWGNAWIGYTYKVRRHDPNLLIAPPPWWPDGRWISGLVMDAQLQTGPASLCGDVVDGAAFLADWAQGQVRLRLRSADMTDMQVRVLTRVNGVAVDSVLVEEGSEAFTWWTPTLDLTPWLQQPFELSLEAQLGESVGFPPQWDAYDKWNDEGSDCMWRLDPTAVAPPRATDFQVSEACPNPFNPVTRLRVDLPVGQQLRVELFDVKGSRVRVIHKGHLPAASHTLVVDAGGLPSGIYVARVAGESFTACRKLLLVK